MVLNGLLFVLRCWCSGCFGMVFVIVVGIGVLFVEVDGGGVIFGRLSVGGGGVVFGIGELGLVVCFGFGWLG